MKRAATRIYVLDRLPLFVDGVRATIDPLPNLLWNGAAATLTTAEAVAAADACDVLVVGQPAERCAQRRALERLRAAAPGLPLLVFGRRPSGPGVLRRLRPLRAIPRNAEATDLASALLALSGRSELALRQGRNSRPDVPLSLREWQVALLLIHGHTLSQAAQRLEIHLKTASTYRRRVLTKLELTDNAALVRYAIGAGWLRQTFPLEPSPRLVQSR